MRKGAQNEELSEFGVFDRQNKHNRSDTRILGRRARIMRRMSLDELPQLLNVVRDDLSMVGSRPPLKIEWEQEIIPNKDNKPYSDYLTALQNGMKFSITGFYTIMGRPLNLSLKDTLELDVVYGNEANFPGDLKILALTIPVLLSMKGGG